MKHILSEALSCSSMKSNGTILVEVKTGNETQLIVEFPKFLPTFNSLSEEEFVDKLIRIKDMYYDIKNLSSNEFLTVYETNEQSFIKWPLTDYPSYLSHTLTNHLLNPVGIIDSNPLYYLEEDVFEQEDIRTDSEKLIDTYFDLFVFIASKVNKQAFLKGNVLLNKLYRDSARSTLDLDIGSLNIEIYDSVISKELINFGEDSIRLGLAFSYNVRDLRNTRNGGIDIRDEDGNKVFAVDVGLDDATLQGVIEYCFDGKYVLGSSIEKILCDKCLSTLSKRRFKRIKDFYDLYIILNSSMKYDINKVINLMKEKVGEDAFVNLLNNYPFNANMLASLKAIWDSTTFIKSSETETVVDKEFMEVYSTISRLYSKVQILGGISN